MWTTPIIDRTYQDVDEIKRNPLSENTKGSWNYFDLNRIENNTRFLYELGKVDSSNLQIKNDWKMTDIPLITDITRIIDNIENLGDTLELPENYQKVDFINTLDYIQVNQIEKNLETIKNYYVGLAGDNATIWNLQSFINWNEESNEEWSD